MDAEGDAVAEERRLTVAEAGAILLARLERLGRRPATLSDYESYLRVHLVPALAERRVDEIERKDIERFVELKLREGYSPKSVRNFVGLLHSIFEYGLREGWCVANPCKLVDKPADAAGGTDIRFLTLEELEAVLSAVPSDRRGQVERVIYLTAAMTGLRQGELLALRWRDIDWAAARIRVRRSLDKKSGTYGPPKSRRSSRSVPMADRVGAELEQLHRRSAFPAEDDLVFAHPESGEPLEPSKLLKRFKRALRDASVRELRFHDLRHTFGTQMAKAGVPIRTLQEWMGHRDMKTTMIYADYAPSAREREWIERAFDESGEDARGWSPEKTHASEGGDCG